MCCDILVRVLCCHILLKLLQSNGSQNLEPCYIVIYGHKYKDDGDEVVPLRDHDRFIFLFLYKFTIVVA
jgi:hypothetical protein